jgi:hypothetical protein
MFVCLLSATISIVMYGLLHQQARLRWLEPETDTVAVGSIIAIFAAAFAMLTGAVVCLWCVRVSHRVCGPLAVMERYFEQLASGVLPWPRPLRQKDEFQEVHSSFARAIQTMRTRRQVEVAALTEAIGAAESLLGERADRNEVLSSLVAQLQALRAAGIESLTQRTARAPERPSGAGQDEQFSSCTRTLPAAQMSTAKV